MKVHISYCWHHHRHATTHRITQVQGASRDKPIILTFLNCTLFFLASSALFCASMWTTCDLYHFIWHLVRQRWWDGSGKNRPSLCYCCWSSFLLLVVVAVVVNVKINKVIGLRILFSKHSIATHLERRTAKKMCKENGEGVAVVLENDMLLWFLMLLLLF